MTDDTNDEPTGADLQALLEELPALAIIRRFVVTADRIAWFSHIGEHLDAELRRTAMDYLDGLGFPDVEVAQITDWEAAAGAALTFDFDSPSWETEEQLRAGLVAEALTRVSEPALRVMLTHVAAQCQDHIRTCAQNAGAIWDVHDEELINAAAGSALQAVHNAAMVLAAGAPEDHPFAIKLKLFEAGRWPIGIAGMSFNLF